MNTAVIIVGFCVIFFSFNFAAARRPPIYLESAKKCIKASKVDGQAVKDIFFKPEAESDDPTVRCFFKCFSEEVKWMDVVTEELLLDIPRFGFDAVTTKIMNTCAASVKNPDPCDRSYYFYKCIAKMKSEYKAANPAYAANQEAHH